MSFTLASYNGYAYAKEISADSEQETCTEFSNKGIVIGSALRDDSALDIPAAKINTNASILKSKKDEIDIERCKEQVTVSSSNLICKEETALKVIDLATDSNEQASDAQQSGLENVKSEDAVTSSSNEEVADTEDMTAPVTVVNAGEAAVAVGEVPSAVEENATTSVIAGEAAQSVSINADANPVTADVITNNTADQGNALIATNTPDAGYHGAQVVLSPADRDLVEKIVQRESGGGDITAAALVAQAMRDAIVYKGYTSVKAVQNCMGYTGDLNKIPNDNTKAAVSYIFDQGGIAVDHEILYFYAPARCNSSFHESQTFITEYGGHRFFAPKT